MLELDGANLTYEEFRRSCLVPNRPAIIRNVCQAAGATDFNLEELMHRLSPQALYGTIGPEAAVPVYPTPLTSNFKDTVMNVSSSEEVCDDEQTLTEAHRCGESRTATIETETVQQEDDKDNEDCREVPLKAVLQSWSQTKANGTASISESRVYYLKDWHLQEALERAATTANCEGVDQQSTAASEVSKQRERGVHGNALYRVPDFLGSDWLDPFCRYAQLSSRPFVEPERGGLSSAFAAAADTKSSANNVTDVSSSAARRVGFGNNRSDYRFAYIGPVGSWTPLHCDVFGTYSWSFNVCGDKLWFFPTMAGNAYLHEHLPPFFPTPPDIRVLTGVEMESVVQRQGDLVFVPARFYHQVHNITGEAFPFSLNVTTEKEAKETNCAASTHAVVGPLTMALNHNWCNAFNVECMTRTFLSDAQRLVCHLSVDDLKVICGTKDVAVCRDYADAMLHSGTNWSYASMTCFLAFCVRCLESKVPGMIAAEDERDMTATRVQHLLSSVKESHEHLFDTGP